MSIVEWTVCSVMGKRRGEKGRTMAVCTSKTTIVSNDHCNESASHVSDHHCLQITPFIRITLFISACSTLLMCAHCRCSVRIIFLGNSIALVRSLVDDDGRTHSSKTIYSLTLTLSEKTKEYTYLLDRWDDEDAPSSDVESGRHFWRKAIRFEKLLVKEIRYQYELFASPKQQQHHQQISRCWTTKTHSHFLVIYDQ